MKRLALLLALTLVLVLGVTATAHAVTPPGTYKLSICTYFDGNSNAWWEANEPGLALVYVRLYDGAGNLIADVWTGPCGVGYVYIPAGTTVVGLTAGVASSEWHKYTDVHGYYYSEATPMKSAAEWWKAKVVMNGKRCMIFGLAPERYTPTACAPCPPAPCCEK